VLIGVVAGTTRGVSAALFYLAAYALMQLGAFAVVVMLRRSDAIGDELKDLSGLYRRQPFAGSHDPEQLDKDPLVRVAPVVMYFFSDANAAVSRAAEAARITAQAPMVLDCVRLFAAMVRLALTGKEKDAVLRPPRETWMSVNTRPEVLALYEGSYLRRMPPEITAGGHVIEALEAALWAFHHGESYREGALLAANLGRDSDVVTAAYGQLAGAYHGVSAIPGIWRNSLMRQEVVIDTADRLLTHALIALGE